MSTRSVIMCKCLASYWSFRHPFLHCFALHSTLLSINGTHLFMKIFHRNTFACSQETHTSTIDHCRTPLLHDRRISTLKIATSHAYVHVALAETRNRFQCQINGVLNACAKVINTKANNNYARSDIEKCEDEESIACLIVALYQMHIYLVLATSSFFHMTCANT